VSKYWSNGGKIVGELLGIDVGSLVRLFDGLLVFGTSILLR
jgi:hypothetical protein